jgi:phage terminase large subunit-like protein
VAKRSKKNPFGNVAKPHLDGLYTAGPVVAHHIETNCRHAKGEWFGKPIVLEPWQRWFINEAFRLDAKTDLRYWRNVLLMLPRKNAKSTIAAALGFLFLLYDAEGSPEVYSAAWGTEQASIVLEVAKMMRTASPELSGLTDPFARAITSPANFGSWKVVSKLADMQQGTNPHAALIDEYHVHARSDLFDAFKRGTSARRQPMMLTITTEADRRDCPLGEMQQGYYDRSEIEQLAPMLTVARDYESRSLMVRWGVPWGETVDAENPEVVRACNPGSWQDPQRLIAEYLNAPGSREHEFRRFHLNELVESDVEGIKAAEWAACESVERVQHGGEVYVGVDIGIRDDNSAVVIAQRVGDRVAVKSRVWVPPEKRTGEELDIHATVGAYMQEVMREYRVRSIRLDPFLAGVLMQEWISQGWPVEEFPQTHTRMCPASVRVLEAVQRVQVAHDGDAVLRQHVLNMVMRDVGLRGWRFDKRKNEKTRKIDAGIAMVMAVDAALAGGGNPYAGRGLLIV